MLVPVLTTPPDAEKPLVALDDAKEHCEVQHGDRDEMIKGLITAATQKLEKDAGRAFLRQVWTQSYGCWPLDSARFPLSPAIAVESVKYYDADNVLQTLDISNYWLVEDVQSPIVKWRAGVQLPAIYGRPDPVQVSMAVGYGDDPVNVPEPIRLAVKMLVGEWYNNREASVEGGSQELPFAVSALIAPFRRVFV